MRIAPLLVCALSTGVVAFGLFGARSSWLALLLYHLVIAASLGIRPDPRPELREIIRGFVPSGAVLAVAGSTLAAIGFYLALDYLDPGGERLGGFLSQMGPSHATALPFLVYVSIVNPILEELHWRGNYSERGRGAKLNDLYYSLFHVPVYLCFAHAAWALVPVLILAVAGLGWRYAAKRFNGLAVPILGHAAGNLGLMIAVGAKLGILP